MREIVLDTETTGMEPEQGHRVVEIGAVELAGHIPTGRSFHAYLNPDRAMPDEAFEVHGLGPDLLERPREARPGEVTLRDKPRFAEVAREFLDFVGNDRLVIHNAGFDVKFLNAELGKAGMAAIDMARVVDTLDMARAKFPGSPASLDALCRRFGVDNSSRGLHGALLDSDLLAEVYLELIGGRQPDFALQGPGGASPDIAAPGRDWRPAPRERPLPPRLTAEEARAHEEFVETLGEGALWKRFEAS